jgi:hypothetical protein
MGVTMAIRSTRPALAALLASALLAMCGCGAESDMDDLSDVADPAAVAAGSWSKNIDACTLITPAEAEALLGEPVEPVKGDRLVGPQCDWKAKQSFRSIKLFLPEIPTKTAGSGYGITPEVYAETGLKIPTATPLSGLGDSAFYTQLGPYDIWLHVLHHGDRHFKLVYSTAIEDGITDDKLIGKARELAEKVISRH